MSVAVGMPDADALHAAAPALATGARYLVCYSGGVDSTALLHAIKRAGLEPLQALHVNHGLQAQASAWAKHCMACCAKLAVPLQVLRAEVDSHHPQGPEAAARAARYQALRAAMYPGDVLVLAHQLDDQAETVLLRLLRGSGVEGSAAMREHSVFPPGRLWRPLLGVSRSALMAYAQSQGMGWIEDPHNIDPRYARSWLRSDVLPLLKRRYPALARTLARAAVLAAEQAALLEELATTDLKMLQHDGALHIVALKTLSPARQRNALRAWLRGRGFAMPDEDALQRIQSEVLVAPVDAEPLLRCGNYELRRYRDKLYAMPVLPPIPDAAACLVWQAEDHLILPPGCGVLQASRPPPRPLRIRFHQAGARLCPSASTHTKTLKNLFQEAGIPPWCRRRTPLIELGGRLVWVPGLPEVADWQRFCAEQDWQVHYLPSGWRA